VLVSASDLPGRRRARGRAALHRGLPRNAGRRTPPARRGARRATRCAAALGGVLTAGLLAAACTGGGGTPVAGPTAPSTTAGTTTSTSPPASTPTTAAATPTSPTGGQPSATSTPAAPPPTTAADGTVTYRIGPADVGRTVTLKVGDHLQLGLTLSGNRLYSAWTLTGYPRSALRLEAGRGTFGQFLFVATARGGGNITAIRSACGPVTDRPCLDPPEPIEPTRTVAPPGASTVFTVTVRVV
jgi:hypothetical protein